MASIKPVASYRSQFDESIFEDWDGVEIQADTFQKIGEYVVSSGEAVQVGYGGSSGQHSAQGRFYLDLRDADDAEVDGVLRIEVHNARDRHRRTLFESRTESLRSGENERSDRLPFPRVSGAVTEDAKIVVTLRPDSTFTLDEANSDMNMDITIHDVR